VLGAAGGIGQPLSLLLKLNPRVTELALYDIRGGPGSINSTELVDSRLANTNSSQVSPRISPTSTQRARLPATSLHLLDLLPPSRAPRLS
jgi:malate/lactate dehydrogenase